MDSPEERHNALLGTVLKDSYRVDRVLAVGGMGVVYVGHQQVIDRTVAIKVLDMGAKPEPHVIERFLREAKLLGALNHPNVVRLIDFGETPDGTPFLVTEFLDGRTLAEIVPEDSGLSVADGMAIVTQLFDAIATAHRQNLIHRDLKPSNVLIQRDQVLPNRVKILDFGIAKSLAGDGPQLTQAGVLMGTPGYLAPEQMVSGTTIDSRADIYALGGLLYFCLTGREPYTGRDAQEIIRKQLIKPPDFIDFSGIGKPPDIYGIITKAMALDPDARYGTVRELEDAVVSVLNSEGSAAPGIGNPWDMDDGVEQDAIEQPVAAPPTASFGAPPTGASAPSARYLALAVCVLMLLAFVALAVWLPERGAGVQGAGAGGVESDAPNEPDPKSDLAVDDP